MYTGLHVKHTLFHSYLNGSYIFLDRFSKIPQIYFMKNRPVGAELFHADGRTDGQIQKANRPFRNAKRGQLIQYRN
jgi:hypothetical protein